MEGTKYTEVGFHGKDVESMIGELVTVSQNLVKERIIDMIDRVLLLHMCYFCSWALY